MPRSAPKQTLVDNKIDEVFSRAGLPLDSPVRGLLDRDAEVYDTGRMLAVHVPRPERDISLDERLDEIRRDPRFTHNFGKELPSVDKRDMRKMSENFADIVIGKVTVK